MESHGEILLKEQYGTSKKRYVVQPKDQTNVVVVNIEKDSKGFNGWMDILAKIFLPHGYPDSVSKDYLAYQKWDTAQAFCSTVMGILATQEVLRGVGVGDTTATPFAATITWVMKDGCGHIGKIAFAYSHGRSLDAYCKKWRLFADILNDAAMCIEIALPLFPNYVTFALCISTVMKAIVGVAGGATRVAMTQHHAIQDNIADVAAKDSAQETVVNLAASLTAVLFMALFRNSLYVYLFFIMMVCHIACNYKAVRAICLRTLNEPRFLQVSYTYLTSNIVASPSEINKCEPIIILDQLAINSLDVQLCGYKIKAGNSLKDIPKSSQNSSYLNELKRVYTNEKYLLVPDIVGKKIYVFLDKYCEVQVVFVSYYNALLLAMVTNCINNTKMPISELSPVVAKVCENMEDQGSTITVSDVGRLPSYNVLSSIINIATTEWTLLRHNLKELGWDVSKHLMIIDEWRIYN